MGAPHYLYRVYKPDGSIAVEGSIETCAQFLGVHKDTAQGYFSDRIEYRGEFGLERYALRDESRRFTAADIKAFNQWDVFAARWRRHFGIPQYVPPAADEEDDDDE